MIIYGGGELMGIGSINDYNSILQDYRLPVAVQEPIVISDIQKPESIAASQDAHIHEETPGAAPVRQDAKLEDISLTFNKQEEFGYIGQDSDIRSLDMEKAISDMKKDQVLQQYQYFVGSVKNLNVDNADGIVIAKF